MRERLEYEIGVIEKTGFADYFLIVQDLIHWAKTHGIAVGPGRGSAAGSLVSYVLDITDINPLTYNLLFERFLNPERIQMPDIDIDFSDMRRDEVLGLRARKIRRGPRGAHHHVRDDGGARRDPRCRPRDGIFLRLLRPDREAHPLQPDAGHERRLARRMPRKTSVNSKRSTTRIAEAKKLIDTARHLEGVARHASVHACGTVIAKDPLIERVPLQFAPQEKNIMITQFEMHAVEDLGLLKIDFLGLRNLTIIEEAIRLIQELHGVTIDIAHDPARR